LEQKGWGRENAHAKALRGQGAKEEKEKFAFFSSFAPSLLIEKASTDDTDFTD
jgi:hypothetical protein